jgi:hypothetical protein
MAGERYFTRIPPASTGYRIGLQHTAQIPYTNKTGDFIVGQHYVLPTSGITIHIHGINPTNSTQGYISVHYDEASTFNGISPTAGEDIQTEDAVKIAEVSISIATDDIYLNKNVIVGYNDPENGVEVDKFGSANVRFEEGQPQLDAFGKLRQSGATLLGEYVFAYNQLPAEFSNTLSGSGAVSWDLDKRCAILSVGTAAEDLVTHTSNTYHHYLPGSSHQFIGTFALGDTGKTGLVRNWGLFDFDNGFMFTQRNGNLGVVVRSSQSGTKVDTFVSQSDWNRDKADGTGTSGMNLDVTKDNIYWLDVQWLGAGRVRFGTYSNGTRIVLHEYYHSNRFTEALSQTASLPVCFSQKNTGGTASTSEMRSWCQAVYTETTFNKGTLGAPNNASVNSTITGSLPVDTYTYVGTLTPTEFINPGQYNRTLYFPTSMDFTAWDTTTGDDVIMETEVYVNPVLSGLNFENTEYQSTVQIDNSATFYGGAYSAVKTYFKGSKVLDLTPLYTNITNGTFKNYSEQGGQKVADIQDITQNVSASLTINTTKYPQHIHREGNALTISSITSGMTEANGDIVYPQMTGTASMDLFTDEALTTRYDTSTYSSYTSGGTITGTFGSQLWFSIVAKKEFATSNDIAFKCVVNWREIDQ